MAKLQTHKKPKKTQDKKKHKTKNLKGKKTKKSTTHTKATLNILKLFKDTIEKTKNISRSKTNLAAKLIDLNKKQINSTYSKTFQSTYTSINKNGKHSEYGQSVLNESTKPFIEIKNLKNGKLTISKIEKK